MLLRLTLEHLIHGLWLALVNAQLSVIDSWARDLRRQSKALDGWMASLRARIRGAK